MSFSTVVFPYSSLHFINFNSHHTKYFPLNMFILDITTSTVHKVKHFNCEGKFHMDADTSQCTQSVTTSDTKIGTCCNHNEMM